MYLLHQQQLIQDYASKLFHLICLALIRQIQKKNSELEFKQTKLMSGSVCVMKSNFHKMSVFNQKRYHNNVIYKKEEDDEETHRTGKLVTILI